MKKLLALIMVLVLCLSLCACGGKKDDGRKLTSQEKKYVGTWRCDLSNLELCSDGVMHKWYYSESDLAPMNETAGTWKLRGNEIVVYYDWNGGSSFDRYKIDGDTLKIRDSVYTK